MFGSASFAGVEHVRICLIRIFIFVRFHWRYKAEYFVCTIIYLHRRPIAYQVVVTAFN